MNADSLNAPDKNKRVMNLSDIAVPLVNVGSHAKVKILGIQIDSRKVKEGDLFLAFPGAIADGRDFINVAIEQGAAAVFFEESSLIKKPSVLLDDLKQTCGDTPIVPVKDLAKKAGLFAANFYGQPSQKMKLIGITGTNGKTTCSHLLSEALTFLGKKSGVIGTLGSGLWGELSENKNTTPDPVSLQQQLAEMESQGAGLIAMEVSSHGLDQGRVNGIDYHTAILTNISRDHLDYHGSMAHYIASKEKLFSWPTLQYGIFDVDDTVSREVFERLKKHSSIGLVSIGKSTDLKTGRGIKILAAKVNDDAISITIDSTWGSGELCNPHLYGEFNVYNLLMALATLLVLDFPFEDALSAISKVHGVPGRLDKLGGGELPHVFVDYAHTPDALRCALTALRNYGSEKLICVFGCGGNRDQGKRSEMGKIAWKYADQIIVTADNPRDEAIEKISRQILTDVPATEYIHIIPDRAEAISHAISIANKGDVVLVAGKGAETYQEIDGKRFEFSDYQIIKSELARRAA